MNPIRLTSTAGAGAVAAIAAWSSWSHMAQLALRVGEQSSVAVVMPLSVDGLLVVASAAMVNDKHEGRRPRTSARIAFGIGVAASVAANIAHAHPNMGARLVAGWPALALLLVVELLSRKGKLIAEPTPVAPEQATPDARPTAERPSPVAAKPRRTATAAAKVAAAARRMPDASAAQIAAKAGVSESTARRHLAATVAAPTEPPARINGHAVLDTIG